MDKSNEIVRFYAGQILRGELKPGQRLPGVHRAAREFHVSDELIREVYNFLQDEGLVERRDYSGTYVFDPDNKIEWADKPKPKPRYRRLIIMIDMGGELIPAERRNVEVDEETLLSIVTPKAA